jgi:hypothetical protein
MLLSFSLKVIRFHRGGSRAKSRSSGRLYPQSRYVADSAAGIAEMTTKAWAMGPSSLIVTSIRAS